jgi:hypothetical protein
MRAGVFGSGGGGRKETKISDRRAPNLLGRSQPRQHHDAETDLVQPHSNFSPQNDFLFMISVSCILLTFNQS